MGIKADDLAKTVSQVLKEYEGATIETMKKAVDRTSKQAVRDLKASSPKRTGAYSRDWASKKRKNTNEWAYSKTVYNKKHYRLTHLLEKGHRKVNGGMVAARPHIAKVEQEAVNELYREIKEGV